MFHCLYYSVTINQSKEKFRMVFCCFSAIKNIVAALSFSNFPVKLFFWEILVFVCLHKFMPIYNMFDDINNLGSSLLYSHHFLTFR